MSTRSEGINEMFSSISTDYDRMNHLLSFGVDTHWRTAAVEMAAKLNRARNPHVLDIGTGTGDLAFAVQEGLSSFGAVSVTGIDFNKEMIAIAQRKFKGAERMKFEWGDALRMKYPASSFDLVTSGFVLRSLDDLAVFARQMHRILKPGGVFVLLDMARPNKQSQRAFFSAYSVFMRLAGAMIDPKAYSWLVDTINSFDKKELMDALKGAGFRQLGQKQLSTGIAYLAYGRK